MALCGPEMINVKFFFMVSASKTGLAEPITSILRKLPWGDEHPLG